MAKQLDYLSVILAGLGVLLAAWALAPGHRDYFERLRDDDEYRKQVIVSLTERSWLDWYQNGLRAGLAWLDLRFGAAGSGRALGVCTVLSLYYSWSTFYLTLPFGATESILGFEFDPNLPQPVRVLSSIALAALPAIAFVIGRWTAKCFVKLDGSRDIQSSRSNHARILIAILIAMPSGFLPVLTLSTIGGTKSELFVYLDYISLTSVSACLVISGAIAGVVVARRLTFPFLKTPIAAVIGSSVIVMLLTIAVIFSITLTFVVAVFFPDITASIVKYYSFDAYAFDELMIRIKESLSPAHLEQIESALSSVIDNLRIHYGPEQFSKMIHVLPTLFFLIIWLVVPFSIFLSIGLSAFLVGYIAGAAVISAVMTNYIGYILPPPEVATVSLNSIAAAAGAITAYRENRDDQRGLYAGGVTTLLTLMILAGSAVPLVILNAIALLLLLPIANGVWDWLSWWISRYLGRDLLKLLKNDSAKQKTLTILGHCLLDLCFALLALAALAFFMAFAFAAYDKMASTSLDFEVIIQQAVTSPWSKGLWLTGMLLSTLVPTLSHAVLLIGSPLFIIVIADPKRNETANVLKQYEASREEALLYRVAWYLARGQYLAWLGALALSLVLIMLFTVFVGFVHQGGLSDYVGYVAIKAVELARWCF
ncbi:MAG: hypothetical protein AAF950_18575 [Pseudomonadota bacterium]